MVMMIMRFLIQNLISMMEIVGVVIITRYKNLLIIFLYVINVPYAAVEYYTGIDKIRTWKLTFSNLGRLLIKEGIAINSSEK